MEFEHPCGCAPRFLQSPLLGQRNRQRADGERGFQSGEGRSAVVPVHPNRKSREGQRGGIVLAMDERRAGVADRGFAVGLLQPLMPFASA